MQRLKRAWNSWMELDKGTWLDNIPEKLLTVLIVLIYLLPTVGAFWVSYKCLDLRHPMYGKNDTYMGVWERVLDGCLGGAGGIFLLVFGIRQIPEMWPHSMAASLVTRAKQRVKKPYRRGKNRFKPTNRRNRQ